jgi:hypothetical protein
MDWLSIKTIVTATSAMVAGVYCTLPAEAALKVGSATAVVHDVFGSLPGQNRKVSIGDDVFEAEFIRTKAESTANILCVDKTSVSIGSNTALKLDRIDLNEDQSFKAMELNSPNGALRWISGTSASSAYEIKTPEAVIHVHGTTFDLLVHPQRTVVMLQEGAVDVCTTGTPQQCKTLSRRGDMITVTPRDLDGPRPGPSDFAGRCLSATSRKCDLAASAEPASPRLANIDPGSVPPPKPEARKPQAPRHTASKAVPASGAPSVPGRASGRSASVPASSVAQPEAREPQAPGHGASRAVPASEPPSAPELASGRSASVPGSAFRYPRPSLSYPRPSLGYPGRPIGYPQPSIGYPRPSFGYPRPSFGYPRPSFGFARPSFGFARPSFGRPSFGYARPSFGYARPGGYASRSFGLGIHSLGIHSSPATLIR